MAATRMTLTTVMRLRIFYEWSKSLTCIYYSKLCLKLLTCAKNERRSIYIYTKGMHPSLWLASVRADIEIATFLFAQNEFIHQYDYRLLGLTRRVATFLLAQKEFVPEYVWYLFGLTMHIGVFLFSANFPSIFVILFHFFLFYAIGCDYF